MACKDGGPPSTNHTDQHKIDELTGLLCELNTQLDTHGLVARTPRMFVWWHKHREADRKRIEHEQAEAAKARRRSELLASMTLEDKDALGLR